MDQQKSKVIMTAGTQIVTLVPIVCESKTLHPAGAVGVIMRSPSNIDQAYRVRFVDGLEESLFSNQIVMLSKFKDTGASGSADSLDRGELFDRVIYRCIIGSRAYGLEYESSDIDYRGIYLPPAITHWSLHGVPEQLEREETQEAYWELQKFIILALKANPNALECLYSPLVEKQTPLATRLIEQRGMFLSKLVYQTFNGYVASQFKKMQADLRNHGEVKWKHVMHLLRLLLSGIHVLRHGEVPVRVAEHRQELLSIRNGQMAWEQTERWRMRLHEEFENAFECSTLPDRPDYEAANRFLIAARRAALADELP